MANHLRFLLALAGLPFAWAVARVFVDVACLVPSPDGSLLPAGSLAGLAGFLLCLVLLVALPAPVRLYVLGHELTHAVWGLLFGARVSRLKVGLEGGSVTLSKSNVLITLAPYFFPFYTMLVALAALVVRAFISPLPCTWAWLFAVGFTWCFHCCFTVRSLMQTQPDVEEYGRLFSYVVIWTFNVAGAAAWVVCATEVGWSDLGRVAAHRVVSAYVSAGGVFAWIYESLRSLPVLQG
jgi:hypothetical protein